MVEPRLTLVRAYRTCVHGRPIRPIVGGWLIVSGRFARQSGRRGSPGGGVCWRRCGDGGRSGGSGGAWAWVGRGYTRSSRMTYAPPSDMQARYGACHGKGAGRMLCEVASVPMKPLGIRTGHQQSADRDSQQGWSTYLVSARVDLGVGTYSVEWVPCHG